MSRNINEINVHCSATRPGWMQGRAGADRVAEIRKWHVRDNGWRDIGYHWLIDRDGQVYAGRPEYATGAFEPKVNATAIGICLIGGFGSTPNDDFLQHYTIEQEEALRQLIDEIKGRYRIKKVTGHNDYAAKACPGFKVARWLNGKPSERPFVASGTAIGSGAAVVASSGLAVTEALPVVNHLIAGTQEVKQAVEQSKAVEPADPLRWVLIALILAGAAFALWRRWQDWQRGRR